jgi:hypothetical protein
VELTYFLMFFSKNTRNCTMAPTLSHSRLLYTKSIACRQRERRDLTWIFDGGGLSSLDGDFVCKFSFSISHLAQCTVYIELVLLRVLSLNALGC